MLRTDKPMNKNDLRAIKSVRDIKDSLLRLIAKKPYNKIHVEEIIKTVPINRKTFYKYFESKDDVLDLIVNDIQKELADTLSTVPSGNLMGGGTDVR